MASKKPKIKEGEENGKETRNLFGNTSKIRSSTRCGSIRDENDDRHVVGSDPRNQSYNLNRHIYPF
jgi:hypothetical protein